MKDETPKVVKCRLYVDGKVVEFDLPGPLVTMPPKPKKGERDGR